MARSIRCGTLFAVRVGQIAVSLNTKQGSLNRRPSAINDVFKETSQYNRHRRHFCRVIKSWSLGYLNLSKSQRNRKTWSLHRHSSRVRQLQYLRYRKTSRDSTLSSSNITAFMVYSSAYGPNTGGRGALQSMPFVDTTQKIVLAVKHVKVPYFIMLGGCGSITSTRSRRRYSVIQDNGSFNIIVESPIQKLMYNT